MYIPITNDRLLLDNPVTQHLVSGIELVNESCAEIDLLNRNHCITYCFGYDAHDLWEKNEQGIFLTKKGYRQIAQPQCNALALYIDEDAKEQTHVARCISSWEAESKWTFGNVYRHPIALVPAQYSTTVLFFKKKIILSLP